MCGPVKLFWVISEVAELRVFFINSVTQIRSCWGKPIRSETEYNATKTLKIEVCSSYNNIHTAIDGLKENTTQ